MAFRNQLQRVGEYSLLDGRLHGPHEALPLEVAQGVASEVRTRRVDLGVLVGYSLIVAMFSLMFLGCLLVVFLDGGTATTPVITGMIVSGIIGLALGYLLFSEMAEVRRLRHGADLVLKGAKGRELPLWFERREDAERVRLLLEAKE